MWCSGIWNVQWKQTQFPGFFALRQKNRRPVISIQISIYHHQRRHKRDDVSLPTLAPSL
jgi:hypothetical protein